MLTVVVEPLETFDEDTNEFSYYGGGTLQLEHSLVSIRKWEAKWNVPFLEDGQQTSVRKTREQIKSYIQCMTINHVKDDRIYDWLTRKNIDDILAYIQLPMTATWFSKRLNLPSGFTHGRNEKITAEVIYCWMIVLGIPVEFEKWHINQLLTLIKVVNIKSSHNNQKPINKRDAAMERARLNAERRARMNSKG